MIQTKAARVLSVFAVLFFLHCQKPAPPTVEHVGALREMMRQGNISARMNLADLEGKPHLYALGAVAELKGEVLILDSQPFVSAVGEDSLVMDRTFGKSAALLVYTQVEKWKTVEVPDTVTTPAQLEAFVADAAAKHGPGTAAPFPFMVTGMVDSAKWHVIDWPEGGSVHTHEKHVSSGLQGAISGAEVRILGFYSEHHHAVFTHHSTNMHLHVISADERIAGHLDDVRLGAGAALLLPDWR